MRFSPEWQGVSPQNDHLKNKKEEQRKLFFFVLALPIFPGRRQPSIFGASELNFRVRNGNGWTLTAINTNCVYSNHFRG